jgi:hypothetical protein
VNHTTKSIATLNVRAAPLGRCWTHVPRRSEGQGPVRPVAVVVVHEDGEDPLKMLLVQNEEAVETFRADGTHEPLRHAVCRRGTKRCANDLNPLTSAYLVKIVREFLVPVANQESGTFRGVRPTSNSGAGPAAPPTARSDSACIRRDEHGGCRVQ